MEITRLLPFYYFELSINIICISKSKFYSYVSHCYYVPGRFNGQTWVLDLGDWECGEEQTTGRNNSETGPQRIATGTFF
mgnify:CR=1 FL=1